MEEDAPHYRKGTEKAIMNGYYINKNGYNPAKQFVYNPRHHKNMDIFLRDLTARLKPPFRIDRLCTPKGKDKVKDLSDIKPDQNYVAIGNDGFKRLEYESIAPKRYRYQGNHTSSGYFGYLQTLNTSNPKYKDVSSRIKDIETHGKFIYVYENAIKNGKHAVVSFAPFHLKSFKQAYLAIAEKISEVFRKKFDCIVKVSDGSVMTDLSDIQHREVYVFVQSNKPFVQLPYTSYPLESFSNSPRSDFRSQTKKQPPVYPKNTRPRTLPTLQHGHLVTGQNYSSPDYSVASNPEDGRNAKRPHNGYPLNKPQRHKPSPERQRKSHKTKQVDYDRNDGIFRAKGSNQETQGAKEVKDSSHTRTDLPIDQRKAEIVSDEEFDDDKDNTKIDSSRKTASPPRNQQQQKNTNNSNVRTSTPDGQTEREREEAAIKIQSQYKAFKQREKMAKEKEDESARKKQGDNDAKKREEEMKKQEAEAKKKEEEAQKEAYNRRIEQELEEMRKKEEEEEKKRQGQGQGEQQKSEKKELSKEEAAAIIQSNYKAFKVREQVREKKKEMESETENNKNENTPAISDFPGDNESVVEGTNNPPGSTAYLSRDASASTSKNAP